MSIVRVTHVNKSFGKTPVLVDISIEAADGELLVLLGPSGCGKTTLLRCIAGLEQLDEGSITIGTEEVTRMPSHKRNVGFVFQSYALYPNLTVFDNIAFPLQAARMAKSDISKRVSQAAEQTGLTAYLRNHPRELSGGQRQRVALARALVRTPTVFLMDEPLSNLDAKLRNQMRREILRLQRRVGVTTFFVTHDQVEAMTMGTRVAVLNAGCIQQIGSPEDIYSRPANTFVAGFIGSPPMNLSSGSILPGTDTISYHGDGMWRVPRRFFDRGLNSKAVTIGIRPEALRIVSPQQGIAHGAIDLVEYLGSESIATVVIGGAEWLIRHSGVLDLRVGQPIGIAASVEDIFLFDDDNDGRLCGTLAELC